MVDVSAKEPSLRTATASGLVRMQPATLALIVDRKSAKGDVLEVARLAGIMAAKRTGELIPLCHPLGLDAVEIDLAPRPPDALEIVATARLNGRTGVEMEAMTAVSVAALTVYDMCKSVDRGMVVERVRLEEKTGGKRGAYRRGEGGESPPNP
jgi:cyclic pyranopterin phosphate synthase